MTLFKKIQNSISLKITIILTAGILIALSSIGFIFSKGIRALRTETLHIIDSGIENLAEEYYEHYLDGISKNIDSYVDSIFNELHLLSEITQIYFTNRKDFSNLTGEMNKLDYFRDNLKIRETWIDNSSLEPTEVFIAKYLLNDDMTMTKEIGALVDDTRFLDLILPVFASSGIKKIQAYYQGGKNREIFRMSPWYGIGDNIYAVYPEMNETPIWDTFNPGLAEQWESLIQKSNGDMSIINNLMRVTPPVQDGLTGEIVLTTSQPIAGNDFTTFEGTISYDIPIDSVINIVEEIKFSETGFAFLTQSNGNLFGINEYGLKVLGLSGDKDSTIDEGAGFNSLKRFFVNSTFEEVQKIKLSNSEIPQIQNFKIEDKEYFLVSKKLKGYQSWSVENGFFQEQWNLGFIVPKDEVFQVLYEVEKEINQRINTISINSLVFSILIIFVLLLILFILFNQVTRKLNLLVFAANEIREKNYDVELTISSTDEVGQLSQTFNSMIKEIKSSFSKLSNEVDERKKSEHKYLSLMETVPDPVIVYDNEGEVSYINPAFLEIFGWTLEELNSDKSQFIPPGLENEIDDLSDTSHFDSKRLTKNNELLDVSINSAKYKDQDGKIIGTMFNLRDISKWKRTQEIIIQSEKMMSFSNLAASMAHDIKNPLAGIVQNAQVISNRILTDNPKNIEVANSLGLSRDKMTDYMDHREIPKMLNAISESVKTANQRIDYMLSFNIGKESNFKPVKIEKLLDSTVGLEDYNLKRQYDFSRIEFIREYADDLSSVVCDKSKIQQVLFNILKNSVEALERVSIENPQIILVIKEEGVNQIIEIKDNGPGMDELTLTKIFEPFFTTKEQGGGTGLGLSVSNFIIVENHKGKIKAESEEGEWTKIRITLPLNHEEHS